MFNTNFVVSKLQQESNQVSHFYFQFILRVFLTHLLICIFSECKVKYANSFNIVIKDFFHFLHVNYRLRVQSKVKILHVKQERVQIII